jgi:GNAT superfamily N-acetyltransferase
VTRPRDLTYRRARPDELLACAQIWSDSIAEYVVRLNQRWFGGDLEPLARLLGHFLATDPTRFAVATDPRAAHRLVGFGSATQRAGVWFLGMLFVLPAYQAAGVGRLLLERILPSGAARLDRVASRDGLPVLGTATDSVQPISNALYSQYGMVPRLPVFNLVGRPSRPEALGTLPAGVRMSEATPATRAADLADLATVDTATLGYAHPEDHEFLFREGRRLFIARSERGAPLGYGHIAPSGRFGPVAAVEPQMLAPLVGHLLTTVRAPGAYASWIPGAAADLFMALLAAGLRFESFPTLLLWDRDFADFSRYVPINLALL